MKKFNLLLGLVLYCSFFQGQQRSSAINPATDPSIELKQGHVLFKKNGGYERAYINNIPAMVLADFTSRYQDPTIASWVIEDLQIRAYFTYNAETIIVYYKKDGLLLSTHKSYDSTRMNEPTRYFLRNELKKGYSINGITEINSGNATTYQATLLSADYTCIMTFFKKSNGDLELAERIMYKRVAAESL